MKKVFNVICVVLLIIFLSIFAFVSFCCEKIVICQGSMETTLKEGQIGLYLKKQSDLDGFKRDDIVIFNYNDGNTTSKFIKRIVGLPNQHIKISIDGTIFIDGEEISQSYLEEEQLRQTYQISNITRMEMMLGENEYYVLGDNREISYDSRSFGVILKDDILGTLNITYGTIKNFNSETMKGDSTTYFPLKFY